jgi:hypothetical protein
MHLTGCLFPDLQNPKKRIYFFFFFFNIQTKESDFFFYFFFVTKESELRGFNDHKNVSIPTIKPKR